MKNVSITSILMSSLLVSCGTYRPSEPISAKMTRYKSSKINPNPVPQMKLWTKQVKIPTTPKRSNVIQNPLVKKSHKNLYFRSLYHQYAALKSYLTTSDETPSLQHCPSYHNTYLQLKEGAQTPKKHLNIAKRYQNIQDTHKYPELNLVVPEIEQTLGDVLTGDKSVQEKNGLIQSALQHHTKRLYLELKEVCDSGTSENYFNFANVATHIERHAKEFHQEKEQSMSSLLRTTVFFNRALLTGLEKGTLKGRFPASHGHKTSSDQTESAVDEKLGLGWTHSYFQEL